MKRNRLTASLSILATFGLSPAARAKYGQQSLAVNNFSYFTRDESRAWLQSASKPAMEESHPRFLQSGDNEVEVIGTVTDSSTDDLGFSTEVVTSNSKTCTRNCINDGNIFCRNNIKIDSGVCCANGDDSCLAQDYNFCNNQFSQAGMGLFACPYELPMCGPSPQLLLSADGTQESLQSRGGFTTDEVCYYWVEAMPSVNPGDLIYVRFIILQSVETFVSIKEDLGDSDIVCDVQSNDWILIRHPNKLYISFKSTGEDSKFFLQAYYAKTATADVYSNKERCSDKGESLGNLLNNGGSSSGGSTNNGGGGGTTDPQLNFDPRINVLTKTQRQGMVSFHTNEPLVAEDVELETEEPDDTTFRVLLLVVGVLMIIVAVLLLANTYVTRKHIVNSLRDREQLRLARFQQRQQQEAQQQSDEGSDSGSLESEEQPPEVVDQMNRIRAINQMMQGREGAQGGRQASQAPAAAANANPARQGQVIQAGHFNLADPNQPQRQDGQQEAGNNQNARSGGNNRSRRRRPRGGEPARGDRESNSRSQGGRRNQAQANPRNETVLQNLDSVDEIQLNDQSAAQRQGTGPARTTSVAIQGLVSANTGVSQGTNAQRREERVQVLDQSASNTTNNQRLDTGGPSNRPTFVDQNLDNDVLPPPIPGSRQSNNDQGRR